MVEKLDMFEFWDIGRRDGERRKEADDYEVEGRLEGG